ncbi:MAG: hypothetical protein WBZ42_02905, partial [Halobacteriota archaeon]
MAKRHPKPPKGKRATKQPSTDVPIPTKDYFSELPLDQFPATYQEALSFTEERFAHLDDHQKGDAVTGLRQETISRIEAATKIPLICYTSKIHNPPKGSQTSINEFDLVGFSDLISTVSPPSVDVFVMSNGGEVEATERIVTLLRDRFNYIRFIVPSNAFSAATLL